MSIETKIPVKSQIQTKISDNKKMARKEVIEMLKIGEILRDRYTIEKKLGRSDYSQIYRAYDNIKSRPVAVKIATPKLDPRRMKIEQMVLTLLRGKNHFVTLISMGQIHDVPYLVMDLVGRNLADIRGQYPSKQFQPITAYRISVQVISALRDMHTAGFLHRNIKPSNICIGRGAQKRVIYLLDHGMARMFTEMDGRIRKPRDHAGFRGTLRYVSLTVHSRAERTPRDDLIAWFYSMIELINGKLPWSNLIAAKDIEEAKRNETFENLCKDQPNISLEFAKYILSLDTTVIPNYQELIAIFKIAKLKDDLPFEWEMHKSNKTKKVIRESANVIDKKQKVKEK
uniref:Protein kinase domain-containing protein n=1 Tax=Wuchereria bancrofti TaxID=6293 RepID=A0AAF5PX10_WUCBA